MAKLNGRRRLYFLVIATLTTGAMKDHGKVILTRERMQKETILVWSTIREELRQYKEASSHYGYSNVMRE